jgi:hypothetical protein
VERELFSLGSLTSIRMGLPPQDWQYFLEQTAGGVMVSGRVSYEVGLLPVSRGLATNQAGYGDLSRTRGRYRGGNTSSSLRAMAGEKRESLRAWLMPVPFQACNA